MGRVLALVALAASLIACTERSDAERCTELEDYLEGAELALPTECAVDTDCRVVWVRPDRPVASASEVTALGIERVLDEYESTCEPIPRATGAVYAVCQAQIADRVIDGANREVVTGRRCVLRGSYEVPDDGSGEGSGAAPDEGSGDIPCDCETSADCPGAVCIACACFDPDPCANACASAFACDQLDRMGLGTDGISCVSNCNAALDREPTMSAFVSCLTTSACVEIRDCLDLLPR